MPTGTGKTEVALAAMACTRCATLVVAPIRDLMYQWHRRILKAFDYVAGSNVMAMEVSRRFLVPTILSHTRKRERRWLHRAVEGILADEADFPVRRIRAFCKLLDDASTFHTDPRGEAGSLRLRVFAAAAQYHPLVERRDRLFEHSESDTKARIADQLGTSWPEIARRPYADVMAFQRLKTFEGYPDADPRRNVIVHKTALKLKPVLEALEKMGHGA